MSFLKKLFAPKEQNTAFSYEDFWNWFATHEKRFRQCVEKQTNIEKEFFAELSAGLGKVREGFYFLVGMPDPNTVELILTVDGIVANFVAVEELVEAAPALPGWRFVAHKPAVSIPDFELRMGAHVFGEKNLFFYANENPAYPDEINITVLHPDLTETNRKEISNGVFIFLDNYLGEYQLATTIDDIKFEARANATKDLVPISKLKDFMAWREKEFVEKYDGTRHDTENDKYAGYEGQLPNGNPVFAVMNQELLRWDAKASHSWIVRADLNYTTGNNGMPDEKTLALLNDIGDQLEAELKDSEGYLSVGRETGDHKRSVFLACRDFRKPLKLLYQLQKEYAGQLNISLDVYRDKYWRTFERFK